MSQNNKYFENDNDYIMIDINRLRFELMSGLCFIVTLHVCDIGFGFQNDFLERVSAFK